MINICIQFSDGKGHFSDKQLNGINMNEIQNNINRLTKDLSNEWKVSEENIRWRKVNPINEPIDKLKISIDSNYEMDWIDFLNNQSVYYKKIRYAKDFYRWLVEVPKNYNLDRVRHLNYVQKVEEMPIITTD